MHGLDKIKSPTVKNKKVKIGTYIVFLFHLIESSDMIIIYSLYSYG